MVRKTITLQYSCFLYPLQYKETWIKPIEFGANNDSNEKKSMQTFCLPSSFVGRQMLNEVQKKKVVSRNESNEREYEFLLRQIVWIAN